MPDNLYLVNHHIWLINVNIKYHQQTCLRSSFMHTKQLKSTLWIKHAYVPSSGCMQFSLLKLKICWNILQSIKCMCRPHPNTFQINKWNILFVYSMLYLCILDTHVGIFMVHRSICVLAVACLFVINMVNGNTWYKLWLQWKIDAGVYYPTYYSLVNINFPPLAIK